MDIGAQILDFATTSNGILAGIIKFIVIAVIAWYLIKYFAHNMF